MNVEITFHGPFRVGAGTGRTGLGKTVNRDEMIPASSLKGVMRATATWLLPGRDDLIAEVFGGSGGAGENAPNHATPWRWTPVRLDGAVESVARARVSIDSATGAARREHLVVGEEVWARGAHFSVVPGGRVPPSRRRTHQVVLSCAAAGVHALGGERRRGLGWVTLRPTDPEIDDALVEEFVQLRSSSA